MWGLTLFEWWINKREREGEMEQKMDPSERKYLKGYPQDLQHFFIPLTRLQLTNSRLNLRFKYFFK